MWVRALASICWILLEQWFAIKYLDINLTDEPLIKEASHVVRNVLAQATANFVDEIRPLCRLPMRAPKDVVTVVRATP
jgi:hypothetical protein